MTIAHHAFHHPIRRQRHAAIVEDRRHRIARQASLDRQQWFAILEASEGRPVA